MKVFNQFVFAVVIVSSTIGFAVAIEALPRGQIQFQINYDEPEMLGNSSHWSVAMPNSYVGVTVVEQIDASSFIGHWQAGVDPLADSTDVQLAQQQSYLNWRAGFLSLWGGRLSSLEQVYLIEPAQAHLSMAQGGLAISPFLPQLENNAIRLDMSSGEYLSFSGQWLFDETKPATVSFATSIKTPEGSMSGTYRSVEGQEGLWGTQLTYAVDTVAVTGAWLYHADTLAWDITTRLVGAKTESFVSYSQTVNEDGRWSAGIQQILSQYITNYSEVIWAPESSGWHMSSGFQIKF